MKKFNPLLVLSLFRAAVYGRKWAWVGLCFNFSLGLKDGL